MEPTLEPGGPITVIRRSQPPAQHVGVLSAVRRSAVAVRFPTDVSFPEYDELLLITGSPGARFIATARFAASEGQIVAFTLLGPWKQLDLRKHARRILDLNVEVRSVLGQSRQDGQVLDISMGGMAVKVQSKPGGNTVEVAMMSGGFTSHLRCDVVSSRAEPSGVILHLRFQQLTPPQLAFVRQLVAAAQDPPEAGQQAASW